MCNIDKIIAILLVSRYIAVSSVSPSTNALSAVSTVGYDEKFNVSLKMTSNQHNLPHHRNKQKLMNKRTRKGFKGSRSACKK